MAELVHINRGIFMRIQTMVIVLCLPCSFVVYSMHSLWKQPIQAQFFQAQILQPMPIQVMPVQAPPFQELISKINDFDVEAVKRLLNQHPDIVYETDENNMTPFFYIIDKWLKFDMYAFTPDEKEAIFQIFAEFIQRNKVDINHIAKEETPLIALLSPSDTLEKRFAALLCMQEPLKYFLARPDLDVSILVQPVRYDFPHYAYIETQNSVPHLLQRYKKQLVTDAYNILLKLFLYLHPQNQRSWHVLLPEFCALQDFGVMKNIYKKLRKQNWFQQEPTYPLLATLNILMEQNSLHPCEAKAFLKMIGGNGDLYHALRKYNLDGRVNLCIRAYLMTRQYRLKPFGKYITRYMKTLANTPQDIGMMIASYSRVD